MNRPTKSTEREQAEQWMLETFGQRMGDYLTETRAEKIGLAVVIRIDNGCSRASPMRPASCEPSRGQWDERFDVCSNAWSTFVNGSLRAFIETGGGPAVFIR